MKGLLRSLGRHARRLLVSIAVGEPGAALYWMAFGLLRPNRFAILARPLHTVRRPTADDGTVFELWTGRQLNEWRLGGRGLPTQFFRTVSMASVSARWRAAMSRSWGSSGFTSPVTIAGCSGCAPERPNQGVVTAYAVVHAANRPSLAAFNGAGFVQRTAVRHIFLFRPTVSLPPMLADPPAPAPHA